MKKVKFEYDPIEQEKKPFWMHSMERTEHGVKAENIVIAITFCIVLILLYYCVALPSE